MLDRILPPPVGPRPKNRPWAAACGAIVALRGAFRRCPLALAAVLLSGCTSVYTLQVESIHRPESGVDLDAKSYVVTSIVDTSTIDGGRLRKQEVARIVAEALAVRGMYQAPSVEHADVVLEISYGMGPHKIEVSELTNPARGHTRTLVAEEVRQKHLTITARTTKRGADGQPPEIVWVVDVRTRDDNADQLRKYLPVLAEVAATWASRNTHGTRSFTATLEDGVLVYISGGYEQPGVAHLPE